MATGYDIAQAYEKVTGEKATYEDITLDAFFAQFGGGNHPAASEAPDGVSILYMLKTSSNRFLDDIQR